MMKDWRRYDDIKHYDENHPGRQKDVKPMRDRNGEVAVRLDLTIVLTPVIHLRFIIIIFTIIIIVIIVIKIIIIIIVIITIGTSSWVMTRLFPLSWSLLSLLTIILPAVSTRGPWSGKVWCFNHRLWWWPHENHDTHSTSTSLKYTSICFHLTTMVLVLVPST